MSTDPYWERTKYNPNLRRDALYVAQQTGSGAAKGFWGAILFLAVAFWPSWALHGETRTVVSWAWYGTVAVFVVGFLAAITAMQARKRRLAEGRLRAAEVLDGFDAPPCLHLNAVPGVRAAWDRAAWWCHECGSPLGAEFGRAGRPCCRSVPGTPHLFECPAREEWS